MFSTNYSNWLSNLLLLPNQILHHLVLMALREVVAYSDIATRTDFSMHPFCQQINFLLSTQGFDILKNDSYRLIAGAGDC